MSVSNAGIIFKQGLHVELYQAVNLQRSALDLYGLSPVEFCSLKSLTDLMFLLYDPKKKLEVGLKYEMFDYCM